jgi:hypothetical protein
MEQLKKVLQPGAVFVTTAEVTVLEPSEPGQIDVALNWGSAVDLNGSRRDPAGNSKVGEFSNGMDEPVDVYADWNKGELYYYDDVPQVVEIDKT